MNFNLDQTATTGAYITLAGISGTFECGNTFTTGASVTNIDRTIVRISRTGVSVGDFIINIRNTSAGVPTGSPIGALSIAGDLIGGSEADITIGVISPIILSPNTQYCWSGYYPNGDVSHNISVYGNTPSFYAGGWYQQSSDGINWVPLANYDFRFDTYYDIPATNTGNFFQLF